MKSQATKVIVGLFGLSDINIDATKVVGLFGLSDNNIDNRRICGI